MNLPDSEVLDIFGRMNSYSVVLNLQEKINADHFSAFKILADALGRKYNEYWIKQRIMSSREILRMQEVSLVADLLIAMREGIKAKKRIKAYYDAYEKENGYNDDVALVEERFDKVVATVGKLYPEGLSDSEFSRNHLFYSLFTAVAHCLFGLKDTDARRGDLGSDVAIEVARVGLDRVEEMFTVAAADVGKLPPAERVFIQDSRRATTDETVRKRRTTFLLGLMG